MKKGIFAILVLTVLLAVVFTGCQRGVIIDEAVQDDFTFTSQRVGHMPENDSSGSEIWVQTLTFTADDKGLQQINAQVEQINSQWVSACLDQIAMFGEEGAIYTHELTWSFVYGDENIVSLTAEVYENMEGAVHPTVQVLAYSFDHITGERLALPDLIGDDYQQVLADYIISQIKAAGEEDRYYPDYEDLIVNNIYGDSWYADDTQIHYFFRPYAIAPYASGIPEFIYTYKQ